ncbi:peptidase domain-containing ABC transporter [Burkholderia sp. Ax-1719]|uniref:peptidase domain-containing ABC transporter n=1 Tax=Burkholderia sp. Ax-1719 TaxID=2608334 RepID=UPI0014210A0E|nr:peptidase domain-containing ABC transporter [Burkholderia sp. Ax-1719]NIE63217.1 peptidase domain-containing ABC transporter [Burkholderia sp. Ax-1719]
MAAIYSLQFGFRRRIPVVLQSEAAECGLACLVMIAAYHGHQTDLRTLRAAYAISLKGITLRQLIDVAKGMQLSARSLRLEPEEIKNLQMPCILHWDLNHFVVLEAAKGDVVEICDPATGRRVITRKELSDAFTGVALELTPDFDFRKQSVPRSVKIRTLTGRIIGLGRSLTQVFILALVIEIFSLIAPFFNEWVVDDAITSADVGLLTTLAIGFGLLWMLQTVVEVLRGWAVLYMGTTLNVQWLTRTFAHLVRLPIAYFERRHLGDILVRASSVNSIQATLTTGFVEAILDGLMSVGTLIMMLVFNPKLSMLTLFAVLLYIGMRMGLYASLKFATESQIVFDAKQQSHLIETIRGIQSVRLFDKGSTRLTAWLNLIVRQKNAALRTQRLMLVFHTGNALVFRAERLLVLAVGAASVIDKHITLGMLLAFIAYSDQFTQRACSLADRFYDLKILGIQTRRLADIVLEKPEEEKPVAPVTLDDVAPSIQLRGVTYRYGMGEKPTVSNATLDVRQGEHLAITGVSGCGKTTLLKILTGLLTPTGGTVSVGGTVLKNFGMTRYRLMFGAVMQDDQLFAGTIAENISFFDDNVDMDWVRECADKAALLKDIATFPMGFNTLVGDMGSSLSGGQKQRVLLARALYKRPKILFLDEATSHLDAQNESIVNDGIKSLKITRIVIAHREETIRAADRVLRMGRDAKGNTVFTPVSFAQAAATAAVTAVAAPLAVSVPHANAVNEQASVVGSA